jgi:hypothetical protein
MIFCIVFYFCAFFGTSQPTYGLRCGLNTWLLCLVSLLEPSRDGGLFAINVGISMWIGLHLCNIGITTFFSPKGQKGGRDI